MASAEVRTAARRAPHQFTRDVVDRVAEALDRELDRAADAGLEPDAFGDPESVARRLVAALPQPSPWAQTIGPVYTTAGVRRLLGGVSRQAVNDRVRRGTLLALETADGRRAYPAFQFGDDQAPFEEIGSVLSALGPHADGWTIASWLTRPSAGLGGRSPIEWMRDGREPEPLRRVLASAARRWAA